MPVGIEISDVPLALIKRAIKQMDSRTFIRLHGTCREMLELCHSEDGVIQHHVRRIHPNLRFIYSSNLRVDRRQFDVQIWSFIQGRFVNYTDYHQEMSSFRLTCREFVADDSAVLADFIRIARKHRIIAERAYFEYSLSNCDDQIKELIGILRPKALYLEFDRLLGIYPPSMFNSTDSIYLGDNGIDYGNSEIIQLTSEKIEITSPKLTTAGIRYILQQFFYGERNISLLIFKSLNKNLIKEKDLVEGLPMSLLYNPESHNYSVLCKISQETVHRYLTLKKSYFYVFWRGGNIEEKWILNWNQQALYIEKLNKNPVEYLTSMLSFDHQNVILN